MCSLMMIQSMQIYLISGYAFKMTLPMIAFFVSAGTLSVVLNMILNDILDYKETDEKVG